MFVDFMNSVSAGIIPGLLLIFILYGLFKKVDVFKSFIEGAKGGFEIIVFIIPYFIAIFVAIAAMQGSGALDMLQKLLSPLFTALHLTPDIIPQAIIRSFSGSGATASMTAVFEAHGPDSFVGRVSSIFQGGTSSSVYIVVVYLGAVGIKKIRHTLAAALLTDVAAFFFSLYITVWMFGY